MKNGVEVKKRKVVLTIDENLEIIKSIDAGTSYTAPVRHKYMYNAIFVQTHSLRVSHVCSTVSKHSIVWNTLKREAKHVRTRSQMHSNEKPNAFEPEDKRFQTRSQTHLNEKLDAFEREGKHVQMGNRPRSLKICNMLKWDSKRLLTPSKTRSKLSTDSVN